MIFMNCVYNWDMLSPGKKLAGFLMTHVLDEITHCWRTQLECQIGNDAPWVTASIRTNLPPTGSLTPAAVFSQTLLKQHFPWNPHFKSSEMCRSDVREKQEYYSQRLSSSELPFLSLNNSGYDCVSILKTKKGNLLSWDRGAEVFWS